MTTPNQALPSWGIANMTWESAKRVRFVACLLLLVMLVSGPEAHAWSEQLEGVDQTRMFVGMTVYISSCITCLALGLALGKWSERRELQTAALSERVKALEAKLQDLHVEPSKAP